MLISSLIENKDECILEIKHDAYVQNLTKTIYRQYGKSSLQEQDVEREVFQVSL